MLVKDNIKIQMRIATVDDITDLSYLGAKTFDQSFGHLFPDSSDLTDYLEKTFSIEKLTSSIAKSHNIYWIVFYGELAIGYAKLQLDAPSEFIESHHACKLQKIYILNEYLSLGIGTKLQQLILNKAIANGYEFVWLSALKSNERSVSFYKRNNYETIGEHTFSIGKENFELWILSRRL